MLKIADIMTAEVFTVSAGAPVQEVAWSLAIRSISGAPVRDARGRLVGTITKAELIDPDRAAWPRGAGLTAGDVMSPRVAVARADEPAMTAVRLLQRERLRQVIVTDAAGGVVGIVTPMDVLKALVHGDRFVDVGQPVEAPEDAPDAWELEATA
jgi:CBS-domain-containing membrane protein